MQFWTVFLQNNCNRSVFTRGTPVWFELNWTDSNRFSFIGFSIFFYGKVKLQLKVWLFLVIVWSQSGFFPVNRTGLFITKGRVPFLQKWSFLVHSQSYFRVHFWKMVWKWSQKWAKNEPKMPTVNNPIDFFTHIFFNTLAPYLGLILIHQQVHHSFHHAEHP